jgi:hypothetical protein
MSAKTQKNWRELCNELHNEQDPDEPMDVAHELHGALDRRVAGMTTPAEGPRTSPPIFDSITQYEPIRIEKGRLHERN